MSEPEDEPGTSRAAGGCVALALGGATFAAVFAASTTAGVLLVWAAATASVWWAIRRHKGPDQPLPSPTESPSRGDVYAGETGEVDRIEKGPGGLTLIYPKRQEANDQ